MDLVEMNETAQKFSQSQFFDMKLLVEGGRVAGVGVKFTCGDFIHESLFHVRDYGDSEIVRIDTDVCRGGNAFAVYTRNDRVLFFDLSRCSLDPIAVQGSRDLVNKNMKLFRAHTPMMSFIGIQRESDHVLIGFAHVHSLDRPLCGVIPFAADFYGEHIQEIGNDADFKTLFETTKWGPMGLDFTENLPHVDVAVA